MSPKVCPIYTVGDGKRTQYACRADGVWFKRVHNGRLGWGHWEPHDPFVFGKYVDRRAGNARLPNE